MGKEENWILDGSWVDRSLVRNQLMTDLFTQMSSANYAAEGRFCTLQLNGDSQGIYRLVEQPKRDDDRVDFAADDGSGNSFLIRQNSTGPLRFKLGLQDTWQLSCPNKNTATSEQKDGIAGWLSLLADALYAEQNSFEEKGAFELLDKSNVLGWILLQELAKNVDAYKLSIYLYKDAASNTRLIPWDFDLSFGQPSVRSWDADGPENWIGERTEFIDTLLEQPDMSAQLSERFRLPRSEVLSDSNIESLLSGYQDSRTAAVDGRQY